MCQQTLLCSIPETLKTKLRTQRADDPVHDQGLGFLFRVQGLGFRVSGSGLRVV